MGENNLSRLALYSARPTLRIDGLTVGGTA